MIKVQDLVYCYPGNTEPTIKGISFTIAKGEIFGFLGPSGAGKSTTQKTLIGILKDYRGTVQVAGQEISSAGGNFYNDLGVSFELPNLYTKLSARENLDFFASLYNKKGRPAMEILSLLGLEKDGDKRVSDYSKGMKMRLNLCRALIHDPDIIFLDEPTSGLDPGNAKKVKNIILDLKSRGKTIFLTTHNMSVADELCDTVAFINDGELTLVDSPRNMKIQKGEHSLRVEYRKNNKALSRDFPLEGLGQNSAFLEVLNNEKVETIHSREASLEDIFIQVTGRRLE